MSIFKRGSRRCFPRSQSLSPNIQRHTFVIADVVAESHVRIQNAHGLKLLRRQSGERVVKILRRPARQLLAACVGIGECFRHLVATLERVCVSVADVSGKVGDVEHFDNQWITQSVRDSAGI